MTAPCRVKVEIAFDAGPATASPTWTDVSDDVSLAAGLSFNRGRGQTSNSPEPGRLQLTLNNDSGDYTWGKTGNSTTLGRGDRPPLRQPVRVTLIPLSEAEWLLGEATLWLDAEWLSGLDSVTVWTGYVDEWAQEWDNGWRPRVRVTASDRLAKLALLNLDHGAIASEVLSDSPVAYWPLDEPAGSVSAGDRAGPTLRPLAAADAGTGGGAVDFGAGASPDTTGTVVAFTQADDNDGAWLTGSFSEVTLASAFTLECWVLGDTYGGLYRGAVSISDAAGDRRLSLGATSIGEAYWYFEDDGVTYATGESAGVVAFDATWHHLAIAYDTAASPRGRLLVDGVQVDTDSTAGLTAALGQAWIGGQRWAGDLRSVFDGQVAHVAVYDTALPAARIAEHYNAGKGTGPFYGDTASERFERLCRLAGLPAGSYATDAAATVTLDQQPLGGIGMLEAIQQVTDSERGIVALAGDGTLTYTADATLRAAAVALTLDNDDIEGDLSLVVNDQTVVNDVTVTRPNGATQRRADETSQATMGVTNAVTVDTLLTTDAAAGALADRLLSEGTAVQPVTGDLTVDLMTKASTVDAAALLGLDTGDRVQVTNLPSSAPVSTLDLRVEGVSVSVSDRECKVTLTVSPALTVAPWLLDDATYSVLGQTTKLAWP